MTAYVLLIRGINVGGKNPVSMSVLKEILKEHGFSDVSTYIASGNVVLRSRRSAKSVRSRVESLIAQNFDLDDEYVKVLVLTYHQLHSVVNNKPLNFGDEPAKFHYDVLFMIDIEAGDVLKEFTPRDGVDTIHAGNGVIYARRLSAQRAKSRLSKIMGSKSYKSMTIRNWNTTMALLRMLASLNDSSHS